MGNSDARRCGAALAVLLGGGVGWGGGFQFEPLSLVHKHELNSRHNYMSQSFDIVTFSTSLAASVLTAWIAVVLAFRKYKSEKWWDRKAQCYCDTVSAMNEIIVVCDAFIDEQLHGTSISKAERIALDERYRKGKEFCFTQTNIGRLLLSVKAHDILMSFERELFAVEGDSDSAILKQGVREVTEGHIEALIPIARKDLGADYFFKSFSSWHE
ncbi:MAG: hypothetical protein Q7J42_05415 [Sulfuritalea sp.]|nr:hypothetical protein [Sulfuritalea sp.]